MRVKATRGTKGEEKAPESGWELTFSAFILILLAFFIMLSSFATMEQSRITRFVKSFSRALSVLEGGLKFGTSKDILLAESADIINDAEILPELKEAVRNFKLNQKIDFSLSDKGLVMTMADSILFDLGEAKISFDALPFLDSVASIISGSALPIRIEGHTDNVPIHTELFPSNWELSTARAVNVLRYLVEKEKIPADRVSAIGYGEFQPLFPNDTAEHRAKNRRVEIVFCGDEKDLTAEG
ncbi:MAG: OmpA family protein, partial [Deltaproteobacteria bacterium]|nr:OmpA family protein [Deltaproteobacteria bacterium]